MKATFNNRALLKVTFNNTRQCKAEPGWDRLDMMDRSDLPQILREILGLTLTLAGLAVATFILFAL